MSVGERREKGGGATMGIWITSRFGIFERLTFQFWAAGWDVMNMCVFLASTESLAQVQKSPEYSRCCLPVVCGVVSAAQMKVGS